MGTQGTPVNRESIRVIPYGPLAERVKFTNTPRMRIARNWQRDVEEIIFEKRLLVASTRDIDEQFQAIFRKHSDSRILVIHEKIGTDTLLSHLVHLNIRSPERFYVAEISESQSDAVGLIDSLLRRMKAAVSADESDRRIWDARIEGDVLRVISPSFKRLEIAISSISSLSGASKTSVQNFEIDSDGSFIYWPELDVHLGWEQLVQIADPEAAQKAQRKSKAFNIRYGAAIKKVRQLEGLPARAIPGLSAKQVGRIERGECRSTSQALQKLADAHGVALDKYMQRVANAME